MIGISLSAAPVIDFLVHDDVVIVNHLKGRGFNLLHFAMQV